MRRTARAFGHVARAVAGLVPRPCRARSSREKRAMARKSSEASLPVDEERSERSERAPQSTGEACGVVLSRRSGWTERGRREGEPRRRKHRRAGAKRPTVESSEPREHSRQGLSAVALVTTPRNHSTQDSADHSTHDSTNHSSHNSTDHLTNHSSHNPTDHSTRDSNGAAVGGTTV